MYQALTYEQFENLVKEMIAFAKDNLFDVAKAKAAVQANPAVETEMVGPMLRVRGNAALEGIDKYNHFVQIGFHHLQLCYYEMEVPERGRCGQLTIVDNYHLPLEDELVPGLLAEFFEGGLEVNIMKTPVHVLVAVCQLEKNNDGSRETRDSDQGS